VIHILDYKKKTPPAKREEFAERVLPHKFTRLLLLDKDIQRFDLSVVVTLRLDPCDLPGGRSLDFQKAAWQAILALRLG
jgi:hypothetical protein